MSIMLILKEEQFGDIIQLIATMLIVMVMEHMLQEQLEDMNMELQKKVTLIAVKVLNCAGSGSWAGVIAGVQWAQTQFQNKNKPGVANMSLGGAKTASLDAAVAAAINAELTFVLAAGNENTDACTRSPANVPTAVTVGATGVADSSSGEEDIRAYFSNYGTCVTLMAPGSLITSDWIGPNNNEINTISGTSMASPHTCGVAALYLGDHNDATPAEVKKHLVSSATSNLVDMECAATGSCSKTPNLLLYSSCS